MINSLFVNKNQDIQKNCNNLIKEIDNHLDDKEFKNWLQDISDYTNLPENEIEFF